MKYDKLPVSYTHLDVYKRQKQLIMRVDCVTHATIMN